MLWAGAARAQQEQEAAGAAEKPPWLRGIRGRRGVLAGLPQNHHSYTRSLSLFIFSRVKLPTVHAHTHMHTSYKRKFPDQSLVKALLPKDKILILPFLKFYKP